MPSLPLNDPDALHALLLERGLTRSEADRVGRLFRTAATAFSPEAPDAEATCHAFFVPGRIEVLGKHTDYAGGRSLTCAVPYGMALLARPSDTPGLTLRLADTGEVYRLPLPPDHPPPPGHWAVYPYTVVRRLARNFGTELRGGTLVIASDLPRAAGMSSSSAFVIAVFLGLAALNRLNEHPAYRQALPDRLRLAAYLGAVENGRSYGTLAGEPGVGTFGGSEDHTAILCSRPGRLRLYTYAPVTPVSEVPFPEDHVFVIAASGVVAEKAGAARERYNRAAWLTHQILARWKETTGDQVPTLAALVDRPGFAPERLRALLRTAPSPDEAHALLERFDHFFLEHHHLLPRAVAALSIGDLAAFGTLVDRSQEGAERLLHNQIPETIFLARSARSRGAVAASAFGAGFGGAVWALVPGNTANDFLAAWRAAYLNRFPQHAAPSRFLIARPGPAAFSLAASSALLPAP